MFFPLSQSKSTLINHSVQQLQQQRQYHGGDNGNSRRFYSQFYSSISRRVTMKLLLCSFSMPADCCLFEFSYFRLLSRVSIQWNVQDNVSVNPESLEPIITQKIFRNVHNSLIVFVFFNTLTHLTLSRSHSVSVSSLM